MTEDWEGKLYCGITLDYNYAKPWVGISVPGYIKKLRQRCHPETPKKPQHIPYRAQPKVYGAAAQDAIRRDHSNKLNDNKEKRVQKVIGGVLQYRRAVDLTVLFALSSIASEQASAAENTEKNARSYWIT